MKLGRHPLAGGEVPSWATEWGEDGRGVFVGFAVGAVVQRMRWVPPGRFVMGSPEDEAGRDGDESEAWSERQREVTLTQGYWLGETPVTQALWQVVMGNNPSQFEGEVERPVETVSWDDCQDFLARLNGTVEELAARLPTEAEWERACRAGTTTATWVGGADDATLDRIAWHRGNSDGRTRAVRGREPNPLGLHDMLGNVWEWCSDWHEPYAARSYIDPVGAAMGSSRVMRGGSWDDVARFVRAACRHAYGPGSRNAYLGFRLAQGQ